MVDKTIEDIRLELTKLANKVYSEEQYIFIEKKQLKHLCSLLGRASSLRKEAVMDFSRCVHDLAPSSSKLSKLTVELYEKSIK